MMENYYCPKYNIKVTIFYDSIPVPTLNNPNNTIPGLIKGCSEMGKRLCQDCPLIKNN